MPWIYKTRRSSPLAIRETLGARSPFSNLRRRLTNYQTYGRATHPGNLIVDVGWTWARRPQCISRPRQGVCWGGMKYETYGVRPLHIVAQQYYYDSIGKKGYWYEYRFEGTTGATYSAWYAAADAATNSSNVSWINNGKASSAVQTETRNTAAAMTTPVLLRLIAEHLQTSRTVRREEFVAQTKRELEKEQPSPAFPWMPIAVVGAGVLLYLRR